MDETDKRLVSYLRKNGRASLAQVSADLGLARNTVRKRMEALQHRGDVVGYTVLTRDEVAEDPIRGLMMLEIAGRGTERIAKWLTQIPEVRAVHSTNGAWDLIVEIGTSALDEFDRVLTYIRRQEGITKSETSLLLSTRR